MAEGRVNKTSERETKACTAQRGGAKERTGAMDDPRALLGKARKGRGKDPGANRCAEAIERSEPTGFICWHGALRARDTALGGRRLRCLGEPTV